MLKGLGPSLFFLTLSFFLGIGEWAWIAFVAGWSVLLIRRLFPRWPMYVVWLTGAWILAAHFNGYKFYGSPVLKDRRSVLTEPRWEFDHVELPNVVVAKDGSRHVLAGHRFREDIAKLPREVVPAAMDPRSSRVRFAANENVEGGYEAERTINYWCGNTWFPSFFPSRLERYELVPLVSLMVPWLVPVRSSAGS